MAFFFQIEWTLHTGGRFGTFFEHISFNPFLHTLFHFLNIYLKTFHLEN